MRMGQPFQQTYEGLGRVKMGHLPHPPVLHELKSWDAPRRGLATPGGPPTPAAAAALHSGRPGRLPHFAQDSRRTCGLVSQVRGLHLATEDDQRVGVAAAAA